MVGFCRLTDRNFVRLSIDASFNSRMYSNLSVTTTPKPLSGLVITKSSRFFSFWIDSISDFGGFGAFLSMYFCMNVCL